MVTLETLRVFLDNLEEGVVFLDARRCVVDVNGAAQRMLGADERSIVNRVCPSMFPGTECARQCETRGACSLTPSAEEGRKIQDIVLRRADGAEIPLRMWAMLLPANDAGLHCAILLRDRSREVALEAEVRDRWQLGGIVGRSPAMQVLYTEILRAAASDANVLVTGESGVGKELVSRALHDNSPRSGGPYIPLHCASLPDTLLDSELFGHAKGAFSGAGAARIGRFEAANGGTLLLDEIGEISLPMQTKLLRVLQEREIVRLGENHVRRIDVRVIAATHRDLPAMVRRGEFREDLFYRLRVVPLRVPPLRERRDDVPVLASRLAAQFADRYKRPALRISREAMSALETYDWPGNVRQLSNALEFAAVQADGGVILRRHLLPEILEVERAPAPPTAGEQPLVRYYRSPSTEDEEKRRIREALEQTGGNKAAAAQRLGMSRTTLWKRLRSPSAESENLLSAG